MNCETLDGGSWEQRFQEVLAEYLQAVESGKAPDRQELLGRHPDLAGELAAYFANRDRLDRPIELPPAGTKVRYFGDYELLDEIGRGGMGVVYKARQVGLKRVVALKMILSGQLADTGDVRRFRAEAQAAAKLDHPGIVPVFEVGEHEGQNYFSMGFIEGESLAHQLTTGLPSPRQTAELIKKVAEAVAYAHVEGVIHRDLKPANILIDKTGQPRLTDFGLAKHVERDGAGALDQKEITADYRALTQTGQILGTPSYMPPEQASGQRGVVGPLADIYSLGAVLYCLLTGRPPFQAANPLDTLLQVLDSEPVPPRQLNAAVPRDLETICLKCLNKEPGKRYASAQDLVADLERYRSGQPIVARPIGAGERLAKWVKRRPAAAALLLVSGIATIGVVGLLLALLHNAQQRAKTAEDLTVARQELTSARSETTRQQALAEETRKKMEKDAENHRTVFRSMNENQQSLIKDTERQKREAKRHVDGLRLLGQSSALRVNNPGLALLLVIEGQRLAPGLMANNALREAIAESLEERTIPVGHASSSAWYTPDGKQIISIQLGGGDSAVRLWDPASGRHMGDLHLPPVRINSAKLSADGKRIVFTFHDHNRITWHNKPPEIIYTDRAVRVWDLGSRKEIAILKGQQSRVVSAQFSPDGQRVVTASWDGTARIWDTRTWKAERVITVHRVGATGAVFSPDGRSIVTASTSCTHQRSIDAELPKLKNALVDPPAGTVPPGVKPGESPGSSSFGGSSSAFAVFETNAVAIWDVETGNLRTAIKHGPKGMHQALDNTPPTFPLAWSPKGDQVLTWSPAASNSITLWDSRSGEARATLPTDFVAHVLFNPDGTRVLSVPHDRGRLSLWDTAGGKEVRSIYVSAGVAGAPSFSADGRLIVCACGDKAARVWSADTGQELWCLRGHQVGLSSAAFRPDASRVVTASSDGTVRMWNLQRGGDYARVLQGSQGINEVVIDPTGRRVCTSGRDARLWDVESGKLIHTLRAIDPLKKMKAPYESLGGVQSLQFTADSRRLLIATSDKRVRHFKRPFFGFGKEVEEDLPFTPVRLWDVETGKLLIAFSGTRAVGRAMLSPNGELVLAAEDGRNDKIYVGARSGMSGGSIGAGQAYIWDAATGKLVQTLKDHKHGITHALWSPDSTRVLTADYSRGWMADAGAARIWDVQSGKPVVQLEGDRGGVRLAAFSRDGKHVLMLHHPANYYVEIWDALTGQIALTLGTPTYYKYSREPDAKGKRTVYKRNGRVIHVAADGEASSGHSNTITHAAYSPDGRRIVTASADRTARIWDAATGKPLLVLTGHILPVRSAVFSGDGKRVVTASDDETARVWNAETGEEIFTLAGHKAGVLSAVFSPDGKFVVTASSDGTARIWPLDPLRMALSRKPRELTAEERERFRIGLMTSR